MLLGTRSDRFEVRGMQDRNESRRSIITGSQTCGETRGATIEILGHYAADGVFKAE